MNRGRLPVEFRDRTKEYASATIRLFVKLPKGRDEIRVLGKQLLDLEGAVVGALERCVKQEN